MGREKEDFRDNLERLEEKFPDKEMLSAREVADYLGLDIRTVRKYFPIKPHVGITKVALARAMS